MAKGAKFSDCIADYNSIMKSIEARQFAPIYLLAGDEGYFIDAIAEDEQHIAEYYAEFKNLSVINLK